MGVFTLDPNSQYPYFKPPQIQKPIHMETLTQSIESPAIATLDLSMIKMKLQDSEEGLGWSVEKCDNVETVYKRFLMLKKNYPDREIVPNTEVDHFWHQHILDTRKYQEDCNTIFGHFVHHYPYFGMNGEEDYQNLCDAFEITSDLYSEHFGEEYGKGKGKCRTGCKPMKCK